MKLFGRNFKISVYINLGLLALFLLSGSVLIVIVNSSMRNEALQEAKRQTEIILKRNLATHRYFNKILKPKLFETMDVVNDDYFEPIWMSSTYAIRQIDDYYQAVHPDKKYYYKECAVNARAPLNEADEYEKAFIDALNHNQELQTRSEVRKLNGESFFVTLHRGEIMEQACLRCHSTPDQAPVDLVNHYGPERSFGRHVGDVVSAISIRIPLTEAYASVRKVTMKLSAILLLLLGLAMFIQYKLTHQVVIEPLKSIRNRTRDIAWDESKLGDDLELPAGRELCELVEAFNEMSTKLRNSKDNLESLVQTRTDELKVLNQQLLEEVQERKLAAQENEELIQCLQDKNEELERFTYTVSHDLKSPLITLRGFLGALRNDVACSRQDRVNDDLDFLDNAAAKMQKLLNDLLELSRIGRQANPFETFPFSEVVRDISETLNTQLSRKHIELVVTGDLPSMYGDRTRIAEVMQNLVDNAIKYMGDRSDGRIAISAYQKEGMTVVSVADNGIGIDPKYLDRIFGLFEQLDPNQEGSGAGLAICKRVTEMHHGRIWAESQGLGKGATFMFEIPSLFPSLVESTI